MSVTSSSMGHTLPLSVFLPLLDCKLLEAGIVSSHMLVQPPGAVGPNHGGGLRVLFQN